MDLRIWASVPGNKPILQVPPPLVNALSDRLLLAVTVHFSILYFVHNQKWSEKVLTRYRFVTLRLKRIHFWLFRP